MKIIEIIKLDIKGWTDQELFWLTLIFAAILINSFMVKDNPVAVISAFCGILYTVIAGKGKVSCYLFGVTGSFCYSYLSFKAALYGNLALYLFYYVPMQIFGFFNWQKHLLKKSNEIVKVRLSKNELLKVCTIAILGSFVTVHLLWLLKDANPVVDGVTTFLSIIGMYLTVRRAIEQWIVWMIVNGLSFFMWLNLILQGVKAYSTLIMWGVYFICAVYFFRCWKKELAKNQNLSGNLK